MKANEAMKRVRVFYFVTPNGHKHAHKEELTFKDIEEEFKEQCNNPERCKELRSEAEINNCLQHIRLKCDSKERWEEFYDNFKYNLNSLIEAIPGKKLNEELIMVITNMNGFVFFPHVAKVEMKIKPLAVLQSVNGVKGMPGINGVLTFLD